MIRIFSRDSGDNPSSYARLILPTTFGSGQVFIPIGARPSSATVAFSRMFDEKQKTINDWDEEDHDDPVVFVAYWSEYLGDYSTPFTELGFWVNYRNVPELDGDSNPLGLDITYHAEF